MPVTAAAQEQPATRFAKEQLKAVVERVERLEEEKKAIADDIKDVYAEAKAHGFDEGAAHDRAAAQAGHRRTQGTGSNPGNLHARARDGGLSRARCRYRSIAVRALKVVVAI